MSADELAKRLALLRAVEANMESLREVARIIVEDVKKEIIAELKKENGK